MASRLVGNQGKSRAAKDYLAALSRLIEEFERNNYPSRRLADHEMLATLIREKGVTQEQVAQATGIANSTLSNVLHKKRSLNRAHIEKLCRYFHVGPGAFISTD